MKSDMITESYKKRGVNRDRFKSVVTPYDSYLDVGCGSGVYLINNNYAIVEGCDIEDLRVDEARKTEFKIQNLPKLEYSDSQFDVVSVFEVLEHVQDYQLSIAELTRITKKKLVISVPNCDVHKCVRNNGLVYSHYVDRTHINFFNKESIIKAINENTNKKIKNIDITLINCVYLFNSVLSCYFGINSRIMRVIERKVFGKRLPKITLLVEVSF
jgi:ubiquinone/menaquinone biosynthesis C-methylase UbiE